MTQRTETDSWIYFIQEIEDDGTPGPYKIGKANNPDGRVNTFQTGNSRRLVIRHVEPGDLPDEGVHHRRFRRYRRYIDGRRTEWFDDRDGKIAAYIAAAPAYGRGPRTPNLFDWTALAWLVVIPRGAWRILLALVLSVFGNRRRRRDVRPIALLGLAAPATGAGLTYTNATEPTVTMWATIAVLTIACTIAGAVKA